MDNIWVILMCRGIKMKRILKMIISIILYLAVYMLMQLAVGYAFVIYTTINKVISGGNREDLINKMQSILLENTSQIILAAIILSLIIYSIVFAFKKKNLFKECRFKVIGIRQTAMIILVGAGIDMIINGVLGFVPVDKWFPSHQQVINSINAGKSFIFTVFIVGIAVPIFEELLLRGIVFNKLRENMNLNLAIIIQALIFGVYHGNMLQFIYASILGIFLGLTYVWTDSLWAPIIIHIFFNSSSLILSKILVEVNILLYILIGIILFSTGIRFLYKLTHKYEENFY